MLRWIHANNKYTFPKGNISCITHHVSHLTHLPHQPKYRTRPREDFPLRGVIKCDCGWHLTASYNKGKNKYYLYYSCPKERNRNYRGEKMHELIEKVLVDLSFTPKQIEKISGYAKENLEQETKDRKLLQQSQEQKLKEVKTKIEKLEERLINDEIETITYKKWFTKLSAEKSSLEVAISNISKSRSTIYE